MLGTPKQGWDGLPASVREAVTACLQWWTADLFLTDDGRIAAVTLDLWEP